MLYIDIDGVLANTDEYIYSLDPRSRDDFHLFFKTIYKHADKVFRDSSMLVSKEDLSRIKEPYCLLTALPNRRKLDSFCECEDELYNLIETLSNNKEHWVRKNIGDARLIIVDSRKSKLAYCLTSNDTLIDDSKSTCKGWINKGGKAFTSLYNYLTNNNLSIKTNNKKEKKIEEQEDKEVLW